MDTRSPAPTEAPLGIGFYSASEAARLIKTAPRNIRRWLEGYTYRDQGQDRRMPPLWDPQLPRFDDRLEIGFRDLVELRFVNAFVKAGVGLKAVRNCLLYARECVGDYHPFSTRRFQTDGRTIFLEGLRRSGENQLLDLRRRQFVFPDIIRRTFMDLDVEDATV